jgi:general nucleoside transport system permease protein
MSSAPSHIRTGAHCYLGPVRSGNIAAVHIVTGRVHVLFVTFREEHSPCIVLTAIVMRTTALGIAIHAAGIKPRAVDKSGLSVTRIRYLVVLFTGFMAALAGAFLSIGDIHTFTEGMTRGAGYLAIAAVIFGNWKILGTTFPCLLFGAATAMQFQLPALGIAVPNALLIMMPYLLALLAVAGLVGRQTAPAALAEPYRRA